jgi:hypothetical protein
VGGSEFIAVGGTAVMALTRDDLVLMANSINEALEALDDWDFPIRVGAERDDARRLQARLAAVIRQLPPDS